MLTGGIRNIVVGALVVAAGVLAPMHGGSAAQAAPVTSAVTVKASSTLVVDSVLENAVFALTNIKRLAVGCPALKFNRNLRTAARKHSYLMGRHATLSHQLPGEPTLGRRITLAGYTDWRRVAENVAAGFRSARLVVRAWWNSTSHRRNITDCTLRELGVGVVVHGGRLWWTQNFGRR